jgi:hypothetical protein
MHTLRRGLLAGVLASLVLAMFDFVTDGAPGNGLPAVLRWFGITVADPAIGRWAGYLVSSSRRFREARSSPLDAHSSPGWRWACSGGSSLSWC